MDKKYRESIRNYDRLSKEFETLSSSTHPYIDCIMFVSHAGAAMAGIYILEHRDAIRRMALAAQQIGTIQVPELDSKLIMREQPIRDPRLLGSIDDVTQRRPVPRVAQLNLPF